jgi:hypothetical protein
MSKNQFDQSRRNAMRVMVAGAAAIPLASLVGGRVASAADLPHLSEDDPAAKALKYVHDATEANRTDKGGTAAADQFCYNCQFIQADSGAWRPCALFPGKAVAEDGWCISWAPM